MKITSSNNTLDFTMDRIRAALAGEYEAALLSDDEALIFDELVGEAMGTVMTPAGQIFWASFEGRPNTDP